MSNWSKGRKKKTKSDRQKAIARLDEKAAVLCKLEHGLQCERCGRHYGTTDTGRIVNSLNWCHFQTRRRHTTRWNKSNTFCLCAGCHMHLDSSRYAFEKWLMGLDEYERENPLSRSGVDAIIQMSNKPAIKMDLVCIEIELEKELAIYLVQDKFKHVNGYSWINRIIEKYGER